MKIYVLGSNNYEGLDITAVYSTKEKALEALPYSEYLTQDDIYEFDLDPPNEGEIYETYYYCNYDPNAEKEKIWGGTTKIKPSDFEKFSFNPYSITTTQGLGKTPEEAEENARKAQLELHPVWQVFNIQNGNQYKTRYGHPSLTYKADENAKYTGDYRCYAVHEDYNVAKIAVDEYMATGKLSPYLTVLGDK